MDNTPTNPSLKQSYLQLLVWLQEHPNFGFWLVLVLSIFLILGFLYLLLTNWRLHRYIRGLNSDKQRLMEEKDLMRRGIRNTGEPAAPKEDLS